MVDHKPCIELPFEDITNHIGGEKDISDNIL